VARREVFSRQSGKDFTEHEQKLLKGIEESALDEYQLLFNVRWSHGAQRSSAVCRRIHYVSGFLDPYVFCRCGGARKVTDRVSERSRMLRISRAEHVRRPQNLDGCTAVRIFSRMLATHCLHCPRGPTLFERIDVRFEAFIESAWIKHGGVWWIGSLMVELVDVASGPGRSPNSNFPCRPRAATRHITRDVVRSSRLHGCDAERRDQDFPDGAQVSASLTALH